MTECCVCYEDTTNKTECEHYVCDTCITNIKTQGNKKCPICRTIIPLGGLKLFEYDTRDNWGFNVRAKIPPVAIGAYKRSITTEGFIKEMKMNYKDALDDVDICVERCNKAFKGESDKSLTYEIKEKAEALEMLHGIKRVIKDMSVIEVAFKEYDDDDEE